MEFHDDITQKNQALMTKVKDGDYNFYKVWFYNCNVYAELSEKGCCIRFDIFDNIGDKVKKNKDKDREK